MVEFGNRLRELRKQKKLTQKQLASLIGVRNSIISFYEVGDRSPSPEIIVKLSTTLGVSSDYLLGIERNETIDIQGLDAEDKLLVRSLIDTLRKKNSSIKTQI